MIHTNENQEGPARALGELGKALAQVGQWERTEEVTRHKSENRVISNGSNRRMKQIALFSGCAPTADLAAKTQKFPVLTLLNAC